MFLCWLMVVILPKMLFSAVSCIILSWIFNFTNFISLLKVSSSSFLISLQKPIVDPDTSWSSVKEFKMEVPFLQQWEDYRLFSALIKHHRIINRGYEIFIDNINNYFNIFLTSLDLLWRWGVMYVYWILMVRYIMYQLSDFCLIWCI